MVATIKIGDFTDVWDNISTVFVGIGLNVVDTASDPLSLLMNLKVDGVTRCAIQKDGIMFFEALGTKDFSPRWLTVGEVGPLAIEGIISQRADVDGGGIEIAGFRQADPILDPTPNAPVELAAAQLIFDYSAWLVVSDQVATEDHYLISKPSFALPDGRFVVPLVQGPEITYTTEQQANDPRAVQLVAGIDADIIGGTSPTGFTLNAAYVAGDTVSIRVVIEENLGRSAIVTVDVELETVNKFTDSFQISGNRTTYINQFAITETYNISENLSLIVSYVDGTGGGARDVDVRGDVTTSELKIQSASSLSAMVLQAEQTLNRFIGQSGEDTRDTTLVETVTADIIGFTSPSSFILGKTFPVGSKCIVICPMEEMNILGADMVMTISLDGVVKFTDSFILQGGRNHYLATFNITEVYNQGQSFELRVSYTDISTPAGARDVHIRGDKTPCKLTLFNVP